MRGQGPRARRCVQFFVVCCFKTVCPSGQGDGLEIHWALPAGVRIPSLSIAQDFYKLATQLRVPNSGEPDSAWTPSYIAACKALDVRNRDVRRPCADTI